MNSGDKAISARKRDSRPVNTSTRSDNDKDDISSWRLRMRRRYHSREMALPATNGTLSVVNAPSSGSATRKGTVRSNVPSGTRVSPSIRAKTARRVALREQGQAALHCVPFAFVGLLQWD